MGKDRVFYRVRPEGQIALSGQTESARSSVEQIYEGLVVDVIIDQFHPEYAKSDGYNVGTVKVRILNVDHSLDEEQLPWADPYDDVIQQLPLIGELVNLLKVRGNFYYMRKIPLARRVQENAMLKLNDALNNRPTNTLKKAVAAGEEISANTHKFGEYYKPDSRVRQIKPFEGDVIIHGRMGHSIRLGSSQMNPGANTMAPNVIIRAGQGKDLEKSDISVDSVFGLVLENIDKDASSLWLVSDQVIPLTPATSKSGHWARSATTMQKEMPFGGAQVAINSDRIIINSKKSNIMLFSNQEIYLSSYEDIALDTDNDITATANAMITLKAGTNITGIADEDVIINAGSDILTTAIARTSFMSDKIYLGTPDDDSEPMVGGTSLSKFLARLILALTNTQLENPPTSFVEGANSTLHVLTPAGPGKLAPPVVQALKKLYDELTPKNSGQTKNKKDFAGAPFNSEDNFVMLKNDAPEIVKNEFKSGEQLKTENNMWELKDTVYRAS